MRRAFWFVLAVVLALVVHLTYMLYGPAGNFERTLASLARDSTTGGGHGPSFKILTRAQQASLLPFATARDVVGICFFDLRRGNVRIAGHAPPGFWNFSVFTGRGRQVYDLNDTQVETNEFVVELKPAPGLLSQIMSNAEGSDAASSDAAWQVQLSENRGLAILWTPLNDDLLRARTEELVSQSSCTTE